MKLKIYIFIITIFFGTTNVLAEVSGNYTLPDLGNLKPAAETTTENKQNIVDSLINTSDNRQYYRFNVKELKEPITIEEQDGIKSLTDISRGGIGFEPSNKVKEGDIIPVHIKYKDTDINSEVRVVYANDKRAGGEFVNLDTEKENNLLYMSIMLEADNGMLVTRIKG